MDNTVRKEVNGDACIEMDESMYTSKLIYVQ